jgi:hypothetical protein
MTNGLHTMSSAAGHARQRPPPAAAAAPAAAIGKKARMSSQAVAAGPTISRNAWVPMRNGIASSADPESPYTPGVRACSGPLTQSSSRR